MFGIKKLYTFVLKSFLPIILATFAVCLFIILMQFLWRYVDDMVGKGIEMVVLAKMLFYAALAFVPLALPLAILLASLMIFGNLGESMELLAIKSAGVSLQKIMRPLIIFLIFISVGAFYFQNNILPVSQVKMWTILWSMRQKSPELDIPEQVFFKDIIPNYNVYVNHKDRKTGVLYDMMIYDTSDGFDNVRVIVADSGKLASSDDKKNLVLTLYYGESFENFKSQRTTSSQSKQKSIPYMRQSFDFRQVLIEFDSNFKMADESLMGGKEIAKNLNELNLYIDSMKVDYDNSNEITKQNLRSLSFREAIKTEETKPESVNTLDTFNIKSFDDFFAEKTLQEKEAIVARAKSKADAVRNDCTQKEFNQSFQLKTLRNHQIEMQKKFTLSFACLIFFFIGAPLGAIIRKGGLGMPTVISVFLFVFYYTIDLFGTKMAKQGVLPVWQGMWISSVILLGLGIFLTYKAVNDSVMLNAEAWVGVFKRFLGKRDVRNYIRKEVIMISPDYENDIARINAISAASSSYLEHHQYPGYFAFWQKGFLDNEYQHIIDERESIIEDLLNSSENIILGKLMDYPILKVPNLKWLNAKEVRRICMIVFPLGLIIYGIGLNKIKNTNLDLKTTVSVDRDLKNEIGNLLQRQQEENT